MQTRTIDRVDWLLLIGAMLGNFLAGLSGRIFLISLPSVAKGLGADILGISWALISYQLAGISLSIVFGRLGDLYGRRKIYGLGFIILTVSSFLCGVSQNVFQLILFRFLQGVGAAMSQSTARALAMDAVPAGSAGKAQSYMTMAFHSGFFVGPPLGGFMIDYLHWRAVFFFIVPFALLGLALNGMRADEKAEPEAPRARPVIDYLGALLLIALAVVLTLLLDRKAAAAVGLGQRGLLALVFGGVLWGFLARENRAKSPLIHLSLFAIRMFTYSVVSLLVVSISRGMVSFLLPFYLQQILHISPSWIGIMFLVPPIFTLTLAPVSGYMTDRVGPRVPANLGVVMSLAAVWVGVVLRPDSHWTLPTLILGLTGIATALFNSANQAAIIGSVPREHRGFATGIVHTAFGLGQMLGISFGGFLLAFAFQYYSGIPGATPSADHPAALVSSMNASYMGAVALSFVALATSFMRGSGKIEAVAETEVAK